MKKYSSLTYFAISYAFILLYRSLNLNFITGYQSSKSNRLSKKAYDTIDIVPPDITDLNQDEKDPEYMECIIEYYDNKNKINIESWFFHVNAAQETLEQNNPSFLRFLYLNRYILGKTLSITCTGWTKLLDINCIECVKLFAGNIYNTGILIPIFNVDKGPINIETCMEYNDNNTIFYKTNNINTNTFCKTRLFL
jgi:hypothetical protein